ncbi:MAG: hypothetical protein PVF28_05450 [Thioalkalispiraceae bacterium]|jgi:hypothetical protein
MIASVGFLSVIVLIAVAMTVVTPIILLLLWVKDWKSKEIW